VRHASVQAGLAWYDRLLRRVPFVEDWNALPRGRVELAGVVEAIDALSDPLSGEACVAIEYRAWPPSTTPGMDGTVGGRAFEVQARQAVEFFLRNGEARILVRPETGSDIAELHRDLLRRYGVNLRADVRIVPPHAMVRVVGTARAVAPGASPMRAEPFRATLTAERIWLS
jgi:hypothetical protein